MATVAAFPKVLKQGRKREGLRVCLAAWLFGVSVREYRETIDGERLPSLKAYTRASQLFGWPESHVRTR
jgi:hypothetical protein